MSYYFHKTRLLCWTKGVGTGICGTDLSGKELLLTSMTKARGKSECGRFTKRNGIGSVWLRIGQK
jgi:hypothetical protein